MKTLQIYVLKELIAPIIVSAAFFVFALMILRLFELSRLLLNAGVSWSIISEVLLIIFGSLLTLTIPMAVLLGSLIGVGRLAAENEILAMRAAGVHLARVFYPTAITSLLLAFGLMWMGHYAVPGFFNRLTQLSTEAQFNLLSNLKPGVMYPEIGTPDSLISLYYEQRPASVPDPEPGVLHMQGVTLRMAIKNNVIEPGSRPPAQDDTEEFIVSALTGRLQANRETRRIDLTLENGSLLPLARERSRRTTVMTFERLVNEVDTDIEISQRSSDAVRELKFPELYEVLSNPPANEIWNDDQYGVRVYRNWRVYFASRNEMIQRFTLPLACVAFVIVAIPLAIEIRPRAKAFSFLIAAGLLMLYYICLSIAGTIGASGALDNSILSWTLLVLIFMTPNLLLAGAGLFLFWRALRR